MDLRIDVGRLSKDELEYLLRIRGVTETGTVDVMRGTLRNLVRVTKTSSFVMPKHPFPFAQDAEAINAKLASIDTSLATFNSSRTSGEFRKLSNKLAFALERINRSVPSTPEEEESRSKMIVSVSELSARLTSRAKSFDRTSTVLQSSVLELSEINLSAHDSSTDISDEEVDTPIASTSSSFQPKPVPVASWGIKFTGDPKDISLGAFLERVMELKVARNSSDNILFKSAVDLFSGSALIWYRANRATFSSWKELVEGLKFEFLSPDYNDRLFDEIKHRTQGARETMGVYVSVMKGLFSRLSVPVSESTQLKIILRNLLPFYQTQLGLVEIPNIATLVKLGHQLEARKISVEAYVPPPIRGKTLEPDLACISSERSTVPSTSSGGSRPSACHAVARSVPTSTLVCWNCKQSGHRSSQCNAPAKRHCYRCGKPDVTVRTCPKCSGNEQTAL